MDKKLELTHDLYEEVYTAVLENGSLIKVSLEVIEAEKEDYKKYHNWSDVQSLKDAAQLNFEENTLYEVRTYESGRHSVGINHVHATRIQIWLESYARPYDDPTKGEVYNVQTMRPNGSEAIPSIQRPSVGLWIDLTPGQVKFISDMAARWQSPLMSVSREYPGRPGYFKGESVIVIKGSRIVYSDTDATKSPGISTGCVYEKYQFAISEKHPLWADK